MDNNAHFIVVPVSIMPLFTSVSHLYMVQIGGVSVPKAAMLGLFHLQCSGNACRLAASAPPWTSSTKILNGRSSLKIKLQ